MAIRAPDGANKIEIIFHLFNYELEASLVDEAAEDLDLLTGMICDDNMKL